MQIMRMRTDIESKTRRACAQVVKVSGELNLLRCVREVGMCSTLHHIWATCAYVYIDTPVCDINTGK